MDMDLLRYVDVFYGNGETDRFFEDGLASKWFYIKALCGNTVPHAVLPFGKMSVGAYSGGYPTGYGTHYPNSCGGIQKMGDTKTARGFSHLHQSGTGAIQYYYNYAIVTPFYGNDIGVIMENVPLLKEAAVPGYYKACLRDVICEMTVDGGVAIHNYTFGSEGGRIAIDFSNNGLSKLFREAYFSDVKNPSIEIAADDTVLFSGEFSGVRLHFCVKAEGCAPRASLFSEKRVSDAKSAADITAPFGTVFDFDGNAVVLRVGFSTISRACARQEVEKSKANLADAAEAAKRIWNSHLSAFQIQTEDEELKGKFYSNLYHSLVKPCDMTGENVLGVRENTVTDFATFWDQYKTVLPLIYLYNRDMRTKVVKSIVNVSETLGKIPCSFGLSDVFPCEEQAKMLGVLALCDAYHMGVEAATAECIEKCTERELARVDFEPFLKNGFFERFTHILDVTDACLDVAEITQNAALKARLLALSKHWQNAYAEDGIMSERSPYYEGDRYTYSFRVQSNMEERVALAGGKKRFAELLDAFFGFGGESLKPITYIGANKEISEARHHRFEGFNNECDMETPYAYIYADRHDRLAEIVHECVARSFGVGPGGLPGNNDSGGLSSAFVFNTLGIFPISGTGKFLIGAPQMDGAQIALASGNSLKIRVHREHQNQIYVERVLWNAKPVEKYTILAEELMRGGLLEFYMR